MHDLISIIIPVYNHEAELRRALDSIFVQTYKNVEVIVVNDGSEKPLQLTNYNLQLLNQENKGAPAARNRGLKEAKGEYVIFWDADVVAEPDMLQKMHHVLYIHPEASYVYSDFYFGKRLMKAQKFSPEDLKQNNFIHSTSLIRTEALEGVTWDESLKRFQDWDLWLTLLKKEKIGIYIPEVLFKVTPRESGISTWLPSFAYKKPFRFLPGFAKRVGEYEEKKEIVMKKHGLL